MILASPSQHTAEYRADIDGLRAIAVLSVIIFHAFPRWFSGGFVGVDIFFVISGFLISRIIFRELENGVFSFSKFYARRARRIIPALLLVLFVTGVVGWYVLTPGEFSQLGKHTLAGAGFFANIAMWSEAGYFDTASDTKPLLHLWSLGVEEQFYIVWPLLLVFFHRAGINKLRLCIAITILSFILNIYLINLRPDFVFYMSFTRFWELLAGAGLAYATLHGKGSIETRWNSVYIDAISIVGFVGVLSSFILIDESMAFPGWWALLPVFGAVLLIAAGPRGICNRVILSNAVARWIGVISYPAYLWHWPLLSFSKIIFGNLSKEARILLIIASFLLAYATYLLIEKKIRFGGNRIKAHGWGSIGITSKLYVGLVLISVCGIFSHSGKILPRSTSRDFDALLVAQYDWAFPPRSFSKISKGAANFFSRSTGSNDYTVFIGDSIVEQYAPRVQFLLNSAGAAAYNSVIFATGPGCPPIPNVIHRLKHTHPTCSSTTIAAYETAHLPNVKVVVIGGNWDNYLSNKNGELVFREGDRLIPYTEKGAVDAAYDALAKEVASLSKNKQVYILLNSPKGLLFSPKSMLVGSRLTTLTRKNSSDTISIREFLDTYAPIRARLVELARANGAKIIDPVPVLCRDAVCPTVASNGDPLFMDVEHMRPFYVREYATFIDQFVQAQRVPSTD